MPPIKLDAATVNQLRQADNTVRLVDEAGNFIGFFVPGEPPPPEPPISEEEIQRRLREGGRSLAEILADLEKRA